MAASRATPRPRPASRCRRRADRSPASARCRARKAGSSDRSAGHAGGTAERVERVPDRAVDRIWHHRIGAGAAEAHVLAGLGRLARLGPLVAHAVAVGVEHERCPALRLHGVAGLVEQVGVEPAGHRAAAAHPQDVVLVELEVMGAEAGVDEGVLHRARFEDRQLPAAHVEREQLGGRMVLLAGVRILRAANAGGVPHAAPIVEHGVMIVGAGVPERAVAPIGRWRRRLDGGGVTGPERQRRVRVAHRHLEERCRVRLGSRIGIMSVEYSGAP